MQKTNIHIYLLALGVFSLLLFLYIGSIVTGVVVFVFAICKFCHLKNILVLCAISLAMIVLSVVMFGSVYMNEFTEFIKG